MKKEDFLEKIGDVPEAFLEEAEGAWQPEDKKARYLTVLKVAAAAAFLLILLIAGLARLLNRKPDTLTEAEQPETVMTEEENDLSEYDPQTDAGDSGEEPASGSTEEKSTAKGAGGSDGTGGQ